MVSLLEYKRNGGRRRFALCYHLGTVYLWNTADFYLEIIGKKGNWTSKIDWPQDAEQAEKFVQWLMSHGI